MDAEGVVTSGVTYADAEDEAGGSVDRDGGLVPVRPGVDPSAGVDRVAGGPVRVDVAELNIAGLIDAEIDLPVRRRHRGGLQGLGVAVPAGHKEMLATRDHALARECLCGGHG